MAVSIQLILVCCLAMKSCTALPDGFTYLDDYYHQVVANQSEAVDQIREHLRYATEENFSGAVVRGYSTNASRAVLTVKAAAALYLAQRLAQQSNHSLLVYDSYRPQKAVDYFVEWAERPEDCLDCKAKYYPALTNKSVAFELPDRYIARQSGHTRGSTVDLTLIGRAAQVRDVMRVERSLKNGQKVLYLDDGSVDMYTSFDLFDKASWHDCADLVAEPYLKNRDALRTVMSRAGFEPLVREWWHYSLVSEPFPDTYFDFEF